MLEAVRQGLWITTTEYDAELNRLIDSACADLGLVGITATTSTTDPLLTRAIITYCRANFGSPEDYDRLKAAYDEQKAQLLTASGYGLEES